MFYHPKMISGLASGVTGELQAATDVQDSRDAELRPGPATGDRAVHRTLVPVDGSAIGDRAVEYAESLARRGLTAEIHLLNVQPLTMQGDFAFDDVVQAEQTARLAAAREVIDRARTQLPGSVPVKVAVRFGSVATAIARYADEHDIASIAMGTHARHSLRNLLRRSVAMQVVRRVAVPVTLLTSGVRGADPLGAW